MHVKAIKQRDSMNVEKQKKLIEEQKVKRDRQMSIQINKGTQESKNEQESDEVLDMLQIQLEDQKHQASEEI